jgi:hypothetical protein
MRVIYWLDEGILVFQEGRYFMQLVNFLEEAL